MRNTVIDIYLSKEAHKATSRLWDSSKPQCKLLSPNGENW